MTARPSDSAAQRRDAFPVIIRVTAVLLLLTLLSVRMVSGLFARYRSDEMSGGGAAVAAGGAVEVLEHQAYFDTASYQYRLNREVLVTRNTYDVLVPGMTIEKDPFIRLTGDNDVSYTLYLEVAPTRPDILVYRMTDHWTVSDRFTPQHGGRVYVFQSVIRPHEQRDIAGLLVGSEVYITADLKNKQRPEENSEPFRVDMYAYLVQAD